jgi:hypothetical protein
MFNFRLDIYHHLPIPPEIPALLEERLANIMVKLSELSGILAEITAQNDKANAEILARLDELEDALSDVDLPEEAISALESLCASVQVSDDFVLDQPPV